MTDWIGKWILYLGDAEWGEDGERKTGVGEGRWEKHRKIARESYNYIHFLNKRKNIGFHVL